MHHRTFAVVVALVSVIAFGIMGLFARIPLRRIDRFSSGQ